MLAIWFGGLGAWTLLAEPSPNVMVFGPLSKIVGALDRSDMRIVDGGRGFLVVNGDKAGFVQALYRGGAWLVLPAPDGGCTGLATRR